MALYPDAIFICQRIAMDYENDSNFMEKLVISTRNISSWGPVTYNFFLSGGGCSQVIKVRMKRYVLHDKEHTREEIESF